MIIASFNGVDREWAGAVPMELAVDSGDDACELAPLPKTELLEVVDGGWVGSKPDTEGGREGRDVVMVADSGLPGYKRGVTTSYTVSKDRDCSAYRAKGRQC